MAGNASSLPFLNMYLFSESSSRALEEEAKGERPVGLNYVEILVGKPAPTALAISRDRRVVGMSCGKLCSAVVNDGVDPYELAVGVHLRDIFVRAKLASLVAE